MARRKGLHCPTRIRSGSVVLSRGRILKMLRGDPKEVSIALRKFRVVALPHRRAIRLARE